MYKVFVNEHPIVLTEKTPTSFGLQKTDFKYINIYELVEKLFQNEILGMQLVCENLEDDWNIFKKYFKIQVAAGGKVYNEEKNTYLFIYRFDKWDLPKGKLEKGESLEQCAIREVEEECGVNNLKIKKSLPTTYHIFKQKNKLILKITYWYLMTTTYQGSLTPQAEEGIKKVHFFKENELYKPLQKTYKNIQILFNRYSI